MTIKTHGVAHGDSRGTVIVQTGVRNGRVTLEVLDGDCAKVHLHPTDLFVLVNTLIAAGETLAMRPYGPYPAPPADTTKENAPDGSEPAERDLG